MGRFRLAGKGDEPSLRVYSSSWAHVVLFLLPICWKHFKRTFAQHKIKHLFLLC